jgi:hypothetical protein
VSTELPAPPASSLIRTSAPVVVWIVGADGWCTALAPPYGLTSLRHPWEQLGAGGMYGDVELLVAVPYGTPPADVAQRVIEGVLAPVAAMMQQLAAAAGAAITAVVADATRRAAADA